MTPLDRALTTLLSDGHWRTLPQIRAVAGGDIRDLTRRVHLLPGVAIRANERGAETFAVVAQKKVKSFWIPVDTGAHAR